MVEKILMVLRMRSDSPDAIAEAFAAHDRTELPLLLGARSRTLFRFQDLYLHLVESDGDLVNKLYSSHKDPLFKEINSAVGRLVMPYSPNFRELKDNVAEEFYHHSFDR
jgi:cyclase